MQYIAHCFTPVLLILKEDLHDQKMCRVDVYITEIVFNDITNLIIIITDACWIGFYEKYCPNLILHC